MNAKEVGDRLRAAILVEARSALALELDAELRKRTPVDTGHARANWIPSVGVPADGEGGSAAHAAGVAAVLAAGPNEDMFVTNNVPYIDRLIAGSSTQAPAGWDLEAVDTAVASVQARYNALDIDVTVGPAGAVATIGPRGDGE